MRIGIFSLSAVLVVSACSHRYGSSTAENTANGVPERQTAPIVDESYWEMREENLERAPSVLIIRPTRYSGFAMITSTGFGEADCKIIGHKLDFATLLQAAYSVNRQRMILPSGVPTDYFDLMLTLPEHQQEALQKTIRRQLGFTARRETRDMDALLLQVKDPDLLTQHISQRGAKRDFKHDFKQGTNSWLWSNFPITTVANFLETTIFLKPVIVGSGLSDHYDITLQYGFEPKTALERDLSSQLAGVGLELVECRNPIEVLVVDKAGSSEFDGGDDVGHSAQGDVTNGSQP